MHDKALITEVRKRLSVLEMKYEIAARDLEATRGFLAMLERGYPNNVVSQTPRTQAEIVGDAIADILSIKGSLHRMDILAWLVEKGVYIGNDQEPRKQLAGLSSIMSSDPQFKPVAGRPGFWTLVTSIDDESPEPVEDTDDIDKIPHMFNGIGDARSNQPQNVQYQDPIAS